MGSARDDFIGKFDADVYPYVINFANAIADIDADVLMFTARKAACLFDAMRSVGLTASRAQVVSTRVLDMDLAWLAGKRVQLVDDLIVTGSSLFKDARVLEASGAASVGITALAIDTDWWVPSLATPSNDHAHISLPDRRALNLCTQIVEAISLVPRPYNLDWPLYDALRVPASRSGVLTELFGWPATNTATSAQQRKNVLSFTLEAQDWIRSRLEDETGLDLRGATLMKVRVYARRSESDASELSLRVVPIVAFDDLHIDDVDRLFESVTKNAQNVQSDFLTSSSKLRMVQYVLAARLGHLWMDDFVAAARVADRRHLEDNQLHFAFPPHVAAEARRLSAGRDRYSSVRLRPVPAPTRGPTEPGVGPVQDVWDLQDRLTEPFRQMFLTTELPAREQLKEFGPILLDDPDRDPMIDRLDFGISVGRLISDATEMLRIPDESGHIPDPDTVLRDARRIVSAYLDIAIDHGVVVPITQVDTESGVVRRAFRHGEDIVFAGNEARLFSIMLKAAFEASGQESLPKIVAEKLCVLFLRIGLSPLNILERFTRDMGNRGSVGVRTDLYGAIVKSEARTMFGPERENGLGKILERRNILDDAGKSYTFKGVEEHSATSPAAEAGAEVVGSLLGELYVPGRGANTLPDRLNDRDLILLASCANPAITAAALGAELDIFDRFMNTLFVRARGADDTAIQRRANILNSDIARAVASGVMKFNAYRADEPRQIIERISRSITARRDRLDWDAWWGESVGGDDTTDPELVRLINKQGIMLLQHEADLACVLAALAVKAGMELSAVNGHLGQAAIAAAALARLGYAGARDEQERVAAIRDDARAATLDADRLIESAIGRIEARMADARALLDQVNAAASHWGRPRKLVSYTSAVHIRADGEPKAVADFWRAVTTFAIKFQDFAPADRQASRFTPVHLPALEHSGSTWVASGKRWRAVSQLAAFAATWASSSLRVRVFVFPDLRETQQVWSGETIADYAGSGFIDYVSEVTAYDDLGRDSPAHASRIVLAVSAGTPSDSRARSVEKYLKEQLQGQLAAVKAKPRGGDHRLTMTLKEGPVSATQEPVDIGILTILPDERRAVRGWFESLGAGDDVAHGGRYFQTATASIGATEITMAVTQAIEPGANSAMQALSALVQRHSPKVIVLLGIAGGIEKLGLGDVVIGSLVIDYAPAADTAEGLKHRASFNKLPASLVAAFGNYFSKHAMPREIPAAPSAQKLRQASFVLSLQPIGTGPLVVKNKLSKIREWLTTVNEKVAAVETEASAIGTFFWEDATRTGVEAYVIVRGISDHADQAKDDAWQFAASENAVTALKELLPAIASTIGSAPN